MNPSLGLLNALSNLFAITNYSVVARYDARTLQSEGKQNCHKFTSNIRRKNKGSKMIDCIINLYCHNNKDEKDHAEQRIEDLESKI